MSKWIGVDLDKTLAVMTEWQGIEHIGAPVPEMVARVQEWLADGKTVKIFTARVADPETADDARGYIEQWCLDHIGEVLEVTNEKDPDMLELWDNAARQVEDNTGKLIGDEIGIATDSASEPPPAISKRERLKLVMELNQHLNTLDTGAPSKRERLKLVMRVNAILDQLGVEVAEKQPPAPEPVEPDPIDDTVRNVTRGQRQKWNDEAVDTLAKIDSGEITEITPDVRRILERYSGGGGNLVNADGTKGSGYEYYTPKPIAAAMWNLLGEMGFTGGKVSDPSAGTGVFGRTAPATALVDAVELDSVSGRINQILNDKQSVKISPYEAIAAETPDEIYDAVITNVPFGSNADRGANAVLDSRYKSKSLEFYFIMRSLDKLKPGGLAAFITPPRVVSGRDKMEADLRFYASLKAEFMGAYRMPNSVFGNAHADTITDVIVFRKHSRDAIEKIKELQQQNPALLSEANVLWTPFLDGKYFAGEGHKYMLGEFIPKDNSKFRDVDRVVSNGSVADIARLLRRFDGSRINWDLLGTAETMPIVYQEGDTVVQDGQTLKLVNGQWELQGSIYDDSGLRDTASKMGMAIQAVTAGITYDQAAHYHKQMFDTGKWDNMPDWVARTFREVAKVETDADKRARYYALATVYAVHDVLDKHASSEPFDYANSYKELSGAMADNYKAITGLPASVSTDIRDMAKQIKVFYSPKTSYSARWLGQTQSLEQLSDSRELSPVQHYERLKYGNWSGGFVDRSMLREALGQDFDPMTDDDWCINADGSGLKHADDYYSGNVSELLEGIDLQIQGATDAAIIAKLSRQRVMALEHIERIDVKALNYTLRSPFLPIEHKVDFLRRYVDPRFMVITNDKGQEVISFPEVSRDKDEKGYLCRRFCRYIDGYRAATGTKENDAEDEERLHARLMDMVRRNEAQFAIWTRANPVLMAQMDAKANSPENLYFRNSFNGAELDILGVRPEMTAMMHDYQNAEVREKARHFGGIIGFDVGLGKTFTALAGAQYVLAIGVKNKIFFVVPSATLTNWRNEARKMFTDAELPKCLFVGLREGENGKPDTYDSSRVPADMSVVMENRHNKIFMTQEAFGMIPLRDETKAQYVDYIVTVDASYSTDSDKKKTQEKIKGRQAGLEDVNTGRASIPYFEDMGVDGLVMDEFHCYKNNKETQDFGGAKFLSVADASGRGQDAQIKAWYIRDHSKHADGVVGLTATPITNSPLEIYNMLTLAVGEERVNRAMMGIAGADDFMYAICDIQTREEMNILGQMKGVEVFVGLNNTTLIRSVLNSVANIKTAADVNLKIPDKQEEVVDMDLDSSTMQTLMEFKHAYALARMYVDLRKRDGMLPEQIAFLEEFSERYGEPIPLLAIPFNLITKMSDLITDRDLAMKMTTWEVEAAQMPVAEKVAALFNKLQVKEERTRHSQLSDDNDVVKTKVKTRAGKGDAEDSSVLVMTVVVKAIAKSGKVILDSTKFKAIDRFLELADKNGLRLTVRYSPKVAAMLENFKHEEAHPRFGAKAKQLIFCDQLGMHHKLKQLLVQEAGLPASAIIMINGITGSDAADMQGFQDGYNAMPDDQGGDYVYRAAICNEKAEVGINLQIGTQAHHHLTIGWTPDATQQRDGRGVRQGNKIGAVAVYHYNANGTFDEYKRMVVSVKSDWIGDVMYRETGGKVAIGGQISDEAYEDMINSIGDAEALRQTRERIAAASAEEAKSEAKSRQLINLQTIDAQGQYLSDNQSSPRKWLVRYVTNALDVLSQWKAYTKNANSDTAGDDFKRRNQARADALLPKLEAYRRDMQSGIKEDLRWGVAIRDLDAAYLDYMKSTDKRAKSTASYADWRYDYLNLVEDSELYNAWQADNDIASNMIEQAVVAFQEETVGFHPDQGRAYAEGRAKLIGQRLYVDKSFYDDYTGSLALLLIDEYSGGTSIKAVKPVSENTGYRTAMREAFLDAKKLENAFIVSPQDPRYDEYCRRAAQQDDAAINLGIVRDGKEKRFFFDIVPEVQQYVTATPRTWYPMNEFMLPSPHFPYVLPNLGERTLSMMCKALAEAQNKLVETKGDTFAFIDLDSPLANQLKYNDKPAHAYYRSAYQAMIAWAESTGNALNLGGILRYTTLSLNVVLPWFYVPVLKVLLPLMQDDDAPQFDSEEAAIDWAYATIKTDLPWLDLRLFELGNNVNKAAFVSGIIGIEHMAILKGMVAEKSNAELLAVLAVGGLIGLTSPADDKYATMSVKTLIKSYNERVSKSFAKWDKDSASWTMTVEAYNELLKDYPDDLKKLVLIAPAVKTLRQV